MSTPGRRAATAKRGKPKTMAHDVARHLRTPEEMAEYIDAWLEEAPDDAAGIARAIGDVARAIGMMEIAREAGWRPERLHDALGEDAKPTTVLRLARALAPKLRQSARSTSIGSTRAARRAGR